MSERYERLTGDEIAALRHMLTDCLPSAAERRRYAIFQAAATIFAGGPNGPTIPAAIAAAVALLDEIKQKEIAVAMPAIGTSLSALSEEDRNSSNYMTCSHRLNGLGCTKRAGHSGYHLACGTREVLGVEEA